MAAMAAVPAAMMMPVPPRARALAEDVDNMNLASIKLWYLHVWVSDERIGWKRIGVSLSLGQFVWARACRGVRVFCVREGHACVLLAAPEHQEIIQPPMVKDISKFAV